MKKEDIEKYNVTVTGLNESDMSTKDALAAGYITQTGFAESINGAAPGETEGHSTEGHSETNPASGSTSETTGSNPTEGHSETNPTPGSEGHSETNPAPGSTRETTGSNPTEGHSETNPAPGSEGHSETGNTTTIGGTEFPNDKSVFVANAGSALIKIATLSSKDLDSLVSLYKLDQESTWPSATDWKKMNVVTKRSTVKSALGLA